MNVVILPISSRSLSQLVAAGRIRNNHNVMPPLLLTGHCATHEMRVTARARVVIDYEEARMRLIAFN